MSGMMKKAKGVSFNYLQFLWSGVGLIRKFQSQGDFDVALRLASSLISYLPDNLKDKFREKADEINLNLRLIASGKVFEIAQRLGIKVHDAVVHDVFQRSVAKQRVLATYANVALQDFVDDLSSELDAEHYMFQYREIPRGRSHTKRSHRDKDIIL